MVNLREQYHYELSWIKEERIGHVIDVAKQVFKESSIHQTNIKTIAKKAHIGEATFYRYFGDKTTLVKLVSLSYWESLTKLFYQYYDEHIKPQKSGFLKVERFLHIFELLYLEHKDFIRFTADYDNYIRDCLEKEGSFEALRLSVKEMFITLVSRGIDDASISRDSSPRELYDMMAQMFMSALQRMTVCADHLEVEEDITVERLLDQYIKMFMNYIKA